jgi:hypothetical protein
VDGSELLEIALEGEREGILGVKRPAKSLSRAWQEGIFGNGTKLVAISLAFDTDILFGDGDSVSVHEGA